MSVREREREGSETLREYHFIDSYLASSINKSVSSNTNMVGEI